LESNRTQEQAARAEALRVIETAELSTRNEFHSGTSESVRCQSGQNIRHLSLFAAGIRFSRAQLLR
jgi:hypothetical protein